jgi:hypothetical protein
MSRLRLWSVYTFKDYTKSKWSTFEESTSSLLRLGLSQNFACCLISKVTESFTIIEKELCGEMPVAPYPNCRDTGLCGIIRCLYLVYDKSHDEAPTDIKPSLAEHMYKAPEELFIPAISSYLDHWIFQTQQNAQALSLIERLNPYGVPLPIPGQPDLVPVNQDET